MDYKITGYEPAQLFHFFEEVSAIPVGLATRRASAISWLRLPRSAASMCIRTRSTTSSFASPHLPVPRMPRP